MLEPEDGAHGTHAIVLAVGDQKGRHLTPKPHPEDGSKEVELQRAFRPEEQQHRNSLEEVGHHHGRLGPPEVGQDWYEQPAADAGHGVDGYYPGGRGQGQALGGGKEHHVPDDNGVAHAAQEVNEGQVPESPGAAGVLQEHLASQLGGGPVSGNGVWVVFIGAVGPHAPVRRFAVEEGQQGEENYAAHGGDYPESHLPARLGNQQGQGGGGDGGAHSTHGLLDSHGQAQLPLEPGGHGGGDVDGKEGLGQTKENAVVEVQLPQLVHGAEKQHATDVKGGGHQQGPACAVTVANPPGHGGEQGVGYTAQHLGHDNGGYAPGEVLLQHHQDNGEGLAYEVGGNPQRRPHAHHHPGVVVLGAQRVYSSRPVEVQELNLLLFKEYSCRHGENWKKTTSNAHLMPHIHHLGILAINGRAGKWGSGRNTSMIHRIPIRARWRAWALEEYIVSITCCGLY